MLINFFSSAEKSHLLGTINPKPWDQIVKLLDTPYMIFNGYAFCRRPLLQAQEKGVHAGGAPGLTREHPREKKKSLIPGPKKTSRSNDYLFLSVPGVTPGVGRGVPGGTRHWPGTPRAPILRTCEGPCEMEVDFKKCSKSCNFKPS